MKLYVCETIPKNNKVSGVRSIAGPSDVLMTITRRWLSVHYTGPCIMEKHILSLIGSLNEGGQMSNVSNLNGHCYDPGGSVNRCIVRGAHFGWTSDILFTLVMRLDTRQ